jgi:LmbE family N-acetylglucosaminyl deacetylase
VNVSVKRALLICGHLDDEAIAMGGTIRKLANQGVEISMIAFGNGSEGYDDISLKDKIIDIRHKEREEVGRILGVRNFEGYDYGDYEIPADAKTYSACIRAIRKYKPDVIFTHYWKEYMVHRNVATIATEAWWQAGWQSSLELGEPWKARALYHFEVIEPLPNVSHVVDITDTFEAKMRAMRAYASQHAVVAGIIQQIEGLAMYRGSVVGAKYGEGFLRSGFVPRRVTSFDEL